MMSLFLYRFPFTLLSLFRCRFRFRFSFLFPFLFLFRIPVSGFSRRPFRMDNNLHSHQILHLSKTVVPKFKIRLTTYLTKGYLI